MPFKRNPINAENINSLARLVASLPQVLWENAAYNVLERTLDDSGNRRVVLPQAFLATEEILLRLKGLVKNLTLDTQASQRNLAIYGTFAATERLLMAAVRRGGDRQALHEVIRQHSLAAWEAVQHGQANPLAETLRGEAELLQLLSAEEINDLLHAEAYVGDAPTRTRQLVSRIRQTLAE
jgi:adenylosuccinate lyase